MIYEVPIGNIWIVAIVCGLFAFLGLISALAGLRSADKLTLPEVKEVRKRRIEVKLKQLEIAEKELEQHGSQALEPKRSRY